MLPGTAAGKAPLPYGSDSGHSALSFNLPLFRSTKQPSPVFQQHSRRNSELQVLPILTTPCRPSSLPFTVMYATGYNLESVVRYYRKKNRGKKIEACPKTIQQAIPYVLYLASRRFTGFGSKWPGSNLPPTHTFICLKSEWSGSESTVSSSL